MQKVLSFFGAVKQQPPPRPGSTAEEARSGSSNNNGNGNAPAAATAADPPRSGVAQLRMDLEELPLLGPSQVKREWKGLQMGGRGSG